MQITSIFAIYFLLWVLSAFFVLPFYGRRSFVKQDIAGADAGAPPQFPLRRAAMQTTKLATIAFVVVYIVYWQGWAVTLSELTAGFFVR